jgi:tetratricopeptide (TPR) repeat protein
MPRRAGRVLRFALAVAGALALAGPAYAQSPDAIKNARQTATDALTAYNAGEYDKALGLFNQAKALYPSAQILRMIGYSELALEHWAKALDALEGALDAKISPLSKEDKKDVQDNVAKALSHVGTVTVTTKVAGAQLVVDGGEPHPLPLDKPLRLGEGPHKLVASAPDHLDATSDLKVEGGKPAEVALEPPLKAQPLPPPPPPPPPPLKPERSEFVPHQRMVGYATAGAGVAFGVAALVTVIEAAHWRSLAASDVNAHLKTYGSGCAMGDPRLCSFDISVTNHEADTADQLRNAAAGLGVTAAVLAATGIVFVVLAPKTPPSDGALRPPPQARVSCGVAGGPGLLCSGAF